VLLVWFCQALFKKFNMPVDLLHMTLNLILGQIPDGIAICTFLPNESYLGSLFLCRFHHMSDLADTLANIIDPVSELEIPAMLSISDEAKSISFRFQIHMVKT